MNRIKKRVLQKWDAIDKDLRTQIVKTLVSVFNYFLNALLLSIPVSIVFYLWNGEFWKMYFFSVICLWIIIPYMEYYYIWFKDKWRENDPGSEEL